MELADTSAWARRHDPRIRPWFERAAREGEIAMCDVVALELLASAAKRDYGRLATQLESYAWVRMTAADWRRALQVQGLLAASTAQAHRMVKIPDLVIAAAAERADQTLAHYDRDFDAIQLVTGQSMRWIAPRGTLGQRDAGFRSSYSERCNVADDPEALRIAGQIPALIWPARGEGRRPAVIYLGGAGQTKEDVDAEARDTALAAGVTVVSFDMYQHGERHEPDFRPPERVDVSQFLDFAERTVRDLNAVVAYLQQADRIDGERIGMRAISLSASAALAAVGNGLNVRACLSICGSGDFATSASWIMRRDGIPAEQTAAELRAAAGLLARLDPLHHAEVFAPCAVMMIHGTADRSVPIEGQRALFEALLPYYADRPQDCVFLAHPGGHGIRKPLHGLAWEWLLERLC